jgi:hypothetical protein
MVGSRKRKMVGSHVFAPLQPPVPDHCLVRASFLTVLPIYKQYNGGFPVNRVRKTPIRYHGRLEIPPKSLMNPFMGGCHDIRGDKEFILGFEIGPMLS